MPARARGYDIKVRQCCMQCNASVFTGKSFPGRGKEIARASLFNNATREGGGGRLAAK